MISFAANKLRFLVQHDYKELMYTWAHELASIPGVEEPQHDGSMFVPVDLRVLELLEELGFQPDDYVNSWQEQQSEVELTRAEYLNRTDDLSVTQRLRPYQRVGATALHKYNNIMLCDDAGCGKTAQAITAVDLAPDCNNILILCPKALRSVWRDEIGKWSSKKLPITILDAKGLQKQLDSCKGGWVIASYDTVRREPRLVKPTWDWVICDESQNIRNHDTKVFRAVKSLRTRRTTLLTATPYGNNPAELWGQLNIIRPSEYTSFQRFNALYSGYDSQTTRIDHVRRPELLRRDLASRMLRRHREDIAQQLPPKTIQTIYLTMNPEQERYYQEMERDMFTWLSAQEKLTAPTVLAQLTRLRQILSTPATIGGEDVSAKLDEAVRIILGTDERVAVFTLYRETVHALERRLDAEGITHSTIMGGMELDEVDAAKEAVMAGDAKVIIMTTQSGGVGLTLTRPSIAVFIDAHYNPEKQEQAESRLHRIGQVNPVIVYYLHCVDTVDDIVEKILQRKLAMTEAVLGEALINSLRSRQARG